MNEYIHYSREELKRVDHLIYVSLKYTRTGDVLKSAINRMVSSYDYMVDGLIELLVDNESIPEPPTVPMKKISAIKEQFQEKAKLLEAMDFYMFLRKVNIAEFTSINEFRRNVTMTVRVDNEPVDVTIDVILEYYKRTMDYIDYMEELITG